jgi:hypothetical protein
LRSRKIVSGDAEDVPKRTTYPRLLFLLEAEWAAGGIVCRKVGPVDGVQRVVDAEYVGPRLCAEEKSTSQDGPAKSSTSRTGCGGEEDDEKDA